MIYTTVLTCLVAKSTPIIFFKEGEAGDHCGLKAGLQDIIVWATGESLVSNNQKRTITSARHAGPQLIPALTMNMSLRCALHTQPVDCLKKKAV